MEYVKIKGVHYLITKHRDDTITLKPLVEAQARIPLTDYSLDELMDEIVRRNEEEVRNR